MKEYNLEGFERGLFELGIKLSEEQKTQFLQYYELLVEWNSFMNLTAITEFDQVITKHFLDSLSLVKVCDVAQAGRILMWEREPVSGNPAENCVSGGGSRAAGFAE